MQIWGDGQQTVDLVHVDHVARCLAQACNPTDPFMGRDNTWDAGSGVETTVLEVAKSVGEITGSTIIELLPMRQGELPGTHICANYGGGVQTSPFHMDKRYTRNERFRQTVEHYKTPPLPQPDPQPVYLQQV